MKKTDLRKLGVAIATAAMLTASNLPAMSYDVDPAMLLQSVQAEISAGRLANAQALLLRLQALGVTQILIAGQAMPIAQLANLIQQGTPDALNIITQIVVAAQAGQANFVVGTQVVAAIDSDQLDAFPVGSAG
jgi:hypothetical protein